MGENICKDKFAYKGVSSPEYTNILLQDAATQVISNRSKVKTL